MQSGRRQKKKKIGNSLRKILLFTLMYICLYARMPIVVGARGQDKALVT